MEFLNLEEKEKTTFIGKNLWSPFKGYATFGGQLAAQSLCAGFKTVCSDSLPSILHTLFVNPGDPNKSIEYEVETLKDGNSIQMRNVLGKQDGLLIVQTCLSFSKKEKNSREVVYDVKINEDNFISLTDYINSHFESDNEIRKKQLEFITENLGVLNNSFYIEVGEFRDNIRQIKIKFLHDDINSNLFSMFVTLLSDLLVVESALLAMNLKLFSKELHKVSSIDHNMYFVSCTIPKDKIIYYILECSNVKESKANITGKICNSEGKLLCITSQQALIRLNNKL